MPHDRRNFNNFRINFVRRHIGENNKGAGEATAPDNRCDRPPSLPAYAQSYLASTPTHLLQLRVDVDALLSVIPDSKVHRGLRQVHHARRPNLLDSPDQPCSGIRLHIQALLQTMDTNYAQKNWLLGTRKCSLVQQSSALLQSALLTTWKDGLLWSTIVR